MLLFVLFVGNKCHVELSLSADHIPTSGKDSAYHAESLLVDGGRGRGLHGRLAGDSTLQHLLAGSPRLLSYPAKVVAGRLGTQKLKEAL